MQMDTEFGNVWHRLLRVAQRVHHRLTWLWLGESGLWAHSLMFIGTFLHRETIFLVEYWRVLILTNRSFLPYLLIS